MKRLLRWILVLLFLAAVAAGAGVYLNRAVLPVKTRAFLEARASQALGRKVSIERVQLHLWHGFLLEGIEVSEATTFGQIPFLKVERLSGGVLFLPILKERRVIIPALHIVGARVRLLQNPDGAWNAASLFPRGPEKEAAAGGRGLQLLIPRVLIEDGAVELEAQTAAGRRTLALSEVEGQIRISLAARAEWTLACRINENPRSRFSLEGHYDMKSARLESQALLRSALPEILPYLPDGLKQKVRSLEGEAELSLEIGGDPKAGPLALEGKLLAESFRLQAEHPVTAGWEATVPELIELTGRLEGRLTGRVNPAEPEKNALTGTLTLTEGTAGPLPYVEKLEALSARAEFRNGGIALPELHARLPGGSALSLSAEWETAAPNRFSLQAKSTLPAEELAGYLPPQAGAVRKLNPAGRIRIEAVAEGLLKPEFALEPEVTVWAEEFRLELPGRRKLTKGRGQARWQPDLLTLAGFEADLDGRPFRLEGSLVNFEEPEVDARLAWGGISTEIRLLTRGNLLEVQQLTGRTAEGGSFRVLGEIRRETNPQGERVPFGNLYAEWDGPASALKALLPAREGSAAFPPLEGMLSGRLTLEGDLREPAAWTVDLRASSPELTYDGKLPFREVSLQARQEEGRLRIGPLTAGLAGGRLEASGVFDPHSAQKRWSGRLTLQEIALSELARQMDWKTGQIAGTLSLKARAEGRGADRESISGAGNLRIAGGEILELPFLGPFASLLQLPSLKSLVFREAEGNFALHEGRVETDALELRAAQGKLTISGSGGFLQGADSPIEWTIVPVLEPALLPGGERNGLGEIIARGTRLLVGEIRLTGTWRNPKRTVLSRTIGKDLPEQLFKELPGILDELLR